MAFLEPDWHSRHIPMWREVLGPLLVTDDPVWAIEIGSYEGRSTAWIAENLLARNPRSSILCIDSFVGATSAQEGKGGVQGDDLRSRFEANTERWADRIDLWALPSSEALHVLCGRGERIISQYDFVYVDGAHDALNAMRDSVLAFDLLKVGGRLIWDDYKWNRRSGHMAPKMAIDAFLDIYRDRLDVLHMGYQVAIAKTAHA